jgi:hypothetical protein
MYLDIWYIKMHSDGSRDPGSPAGSLLLDRPKAAPGTSARLHEVTTSSGLPRPPTPTDSKVGMTKAYVPNCTKAPTGLRLAREHLPDRHAGREARPSVPAGPRSRCRG